MIGVYDVLDTEDVLQVHSEALEVLLRVDGCLGSAQLDLGSVVVELFIIHSWFCGYFQELRYRLAEHRQSIFRLLPILDKEIDLG